MILFVSVTFALNLVATIKPYALIIKDIVGNRAQVHTLIDPGINPHVFSPKMSDIRYLLSADLVVMNGMKLEEFLIEKLESMKSDINIVQAGDLIPADVLKELNGGREHINPHVWLSIEFLTRYIIPGITEKLCELDEENREYFRENSEALIVKLRELKDEYYGIFSNYTGKSVLVYHPSFYYFFNEYGINTVSISEGHNDKPTMRKIIKIVDSIKEGNIVAIFGEKQQNLEPIKLISKQAGAPFEILDPIGYSANSTVELFEQNFKSIVRVLGK